MVRVCKTLNRGSSPLDASWMDADEDPDRARLLAEMRAYGSATPFIQAAPARRRGNVYDDAMGEWLRSRTFKTIVTLACGLPAILICTLMIGTVAAVTILGYGIIDGLRQALEMGGW